MHYLKKIMIVDDEPTIIDVTRQGLEKTGRYQTVSTTRGTEAVSLAQKEQPDLILLDINMPDLAGGDIARILSETDETKDIPILFLTGIVTEKDIDLSGGVIGGRQMIAKVSGLKKLILRIDQMLQQ